MVEEMYGKIHTGGLNQEFDDFIKYGKPINFLAKTIGECKLIQKKAEIARKYYEILISIAISVGVFGGAVFFTAIGLIPTIQNSFDFQMDRSVFLFGFAFIVIGWVIYKKFAKPRFDMCQGCIWEAECEIQRKKALPQDFGI